MVESAHNEHDPESGELAETSRRSFLGLFCGILSAVIGLLLGVPLIGSFLSPMFAKKKPLWVKLGGKPKEEGRPQRYTFRYVRIDGWMEKTVHGTAYAVYTDQGLQVLSNVCTHLGCGVRWDDEKGAFLCPCHNGKFDMSGKPTEGPPPKPLDRYEHRILDDVLEIQIKEV